MTEETIGVLLAALILGALVWFANRRSYNVQGGSVQPVSTTLSQAANPDDFVSGPTYFVAYQPYYFAPPIGNIMPPASASRTIQSNIDNGGCGC